MKSSFRSMSLLFSFLRLGFIWEMAQQFRAHATKAQEPKFQPSFHPKPGHCHDCLSTLVLADTEKWIPEAHCHCQPVQPRVNFRLRERLHQEKKKKKVEGDRKRHAMFLPTSSCVCILMHTLNTEIVRKWTVFCQLCFHMVMKWTVGGLEAQPHSIMDRSDGESMRHS